MGSILSENKSSVFHPKTDQTQFSKTAIMNAAPCVNDSLLGIRRN